MVWNPISTRFSALLWVTIWKILDIISTRELVTLSSTRELSPFINLVSPIIGFDTALIITMFTALGMAHVFYYRIPVVVEVLAVYLPVAVVGNFSVYIHPLLNNIIVATGMASLILYLVYYEITHRYYNRSPTETRFLATSSAGRYAYAE